MPNVPTSANILTQKKEQKSLLLESVIPAVEAVLLVSLEHSKRCAIFVVFTHTALTDKYIDFLTREVWGVLYSSTYG